VTGIYYTDLLDVLRAAGCQVAESSTTNGWQRRARSSGGFPAPPLGVQWHHTASSTSPANDLSYMINGNQDAPVGNLLLDRTGTFWPIAAGAANTAGKGGPLNMSRGQVKQDNANATTFAIEAANNGVGEAWPAVMIDAYFLGSNALNVRFGNLASDIFNHQTWAPTRKIDPATAAAVQGGWCPGSSTSSGTWRQSDVCAEATRRAAAVAPPEEEDWMSALSDDEQRELLDKVRAVYWMVGNMDPSPENTDSAIGTRVARIHDWAQGTFWMVGNTMPSPEAAPDAIGTRVGEILRIVSPPAP
jgi:hypothetical protein